MVRIPHLLVLCLCACAGEPEGAEPAPKGKLDLSWLVPGGCDDAGVSDIEVFASDRLLGSAACEDGALVARVRTGLQVLTLEGLDHDGQPRYAAESVVLVEEGERVLVPTLVLEALPAEVEVTWFFSNARLCSHNGVGTIEAAAFEDGTRVARAVADCDAGGMVLRDVPAGSYLLDVIGRDDDGRALVHGEHELQAGKGEALAVEVELAQL